MGAPIQLHFEITWGALTNTNSNPSLRDCLYWTGVQSGNCNFCGFPGHCNVQPGLTTALTPSPKQYWQLQQINQKYFDLWRNSVGWFSVAVFL